MTVPNLRPLGFGEILDGAFTLYRRHLATFLLTSLILAVAILGLIGIFGVSVFAAVASGDPSAVMGAIGAMFLMMLVGGLVYIVLWSALTREASQAYLGQPTSLGDGLRTGLRKLLPALGASILVFVALVAAYIVFAIVFGVIAAIGMGSGDGAVAFIVMTVAGIAFLVGYLMFIGMLFAVFPAIIVEDKGPIDAISRSFDLARGALGRIVGLMLVTLIIVYLPAIAVMWLTGSFESLTNPGVVPSTGQFLTQQLLAWGVNVLTMPFMASVIVLLYYDRRVRTEALDVQMAADRLSVAGY